MEQPSRPTAYAAEAKWHRNQAEEFRAKAELMADEDTRAQYFRLAEAYEAMAENEERVSVLKRE
jgi:hypothetical protein